MRTTLDAILDLLDDGLRLYRRAFVPMLILVSIAALPLSLILVALVIAADWLATGVGAALTLLAVVLGIPGSIYMIGALSRAAAMAVDQQPIRLRAALAIRPLRVLSMGCFGTVFALLASILVSAISTMFFCVAYVVVVAVVGVAVSIGANNGAGEAAAGFLFALAIIAFVVIYAISLVINGAIYGSLVFVLQPFVHERARLGQTVRRSLDLLTFRMGQNLLAFLLASLVWSAAALAATVAIGVLFPLPALFFLGSDSTAARAITAASWVAGLSAALPLLPIWMLLLYRRQVTAREGLDLAERIGKLAVTQEYAVYD